MAEKIGTESPRMTACDEEAHAPGSCYVEEMPPCPHTLVPVDGCPPDFDAASKPKDLGAANSGNCGLVVVLEESLKGRKWYKWAALATSSLLSLGVVCNYNVPGAVGTGDGMTIRRWFEEAGKEFTENDNQWLYGAFGWPNVVLAVLWGVICDKYLGLRRTALLSAGIALVSAIIFAVGVQMRLYSIMVAGRLVLAISGESYCLVRAVAAARWFGSSKYLAVAFGVHALMSCAGTACSFILLPWVARGWGIVASMYAAAGCMAISFFSMIAFAAIDIRGERLGLVAPCSTVGNAGVSIAQLFRLPLLSWACIVLTFLMYAFRLPLIGIAVNFVARVYNEAHDSAAAMVGVFQLATAPVVLVAGRIMDRTGRYTLWLLVSMLGYFLTVGPFVAGITMPVTLMFSFLCIGFAAQVSVSVCLSRVTPANLFGVANGVAFSFVSIGLGTVPLILSAVLDKHTAPLDLTAVDAAGHHRVAVPSREGFRQACVVLSIVALCGIAVTALIWILDLRRGGDLSAARPCCRSGHRQCKEVDDDEPNDGVEMTEAESMD